MVLRNISEFKKGNRKKEEGTPKNIKAGHIYEFLKKGQRNYWREGEIALLETNDGRLSRPIASIIILEVTHFLFNGQVYTKGNYKVIEVFDSNDSKIHFNWVAMVH
ncbi:MAG: hypothetical protein NT129_04455 [Candidatus Aenigmarchaeota archaeon]|nr:hypothetical protein [Candidatus Aenigmarchaeota archaeon]